MRVLNTSITGVLKLSGGAASQRTRRRARRRLAAAIFALCMLGIVGTAAQEKEDSKGRFLVARRGLSDPFFAKSVVLMLPVKGAPLLVGLIVNKPTRVRLRDLFADSPALQKRDETAYFGGPVGVDVGARSAVFRSAKPPKNATLVFGDIYVTFDPSTITALVEDPQQASTLRVFLGRAQWAPTQLQDEITKGAWHNVRGGAEPIFSTFPEAAWRALLNRAEPRPLM